MERKKNCGKPQHCAHSHTLLAGLKNPYKLNQAADADSRWALGDPALVFFHPRGAGDIEVKPRRVVDELFQEDRSGAGTAPASAGVHNVGNVGADLIKIYLVERKSPEL